MSFPPLGPASKYQVNPDNSSERALGSPATCTFPQIGSSSAPITRAEHVPPENSQFISTPFQKLNTTSGSVDKVARKLGVTSQEASHEMMVESEGDGLEWPTYGRRASSRSTCSTSACSSPSISSTHKLGVSPQSTSPGDTPTRGTPTRGTPSRIIPSPLSMPSAVVPLPGASLPMFTHTVTQRSLNRSENNWSTPSLLSLPRLKNFPAPLQAKDS